MADTGQQLHPFVQAAWKKHDEWLENGGDSAMRQVREANLISNVSEQLYAAEGEGFKKGHTAGWKKGYEDGVAAERRKNEPQPPEPPTS